VGWEYRVCGGAFEIMGPASDLSLAQSTSFHFLSHTLLVLVSLEKQGETQTAFVATASSCLIARAKTQPLLP